MNNDIEKLLEFISLDKDYSLAEIIPFNNGESLSIKLYFSTHINIELMDDNYYLWFNHNDKEISFYRKCFENIEEVKNFLLNNKKIIFDIDYKCKEIRNLVNEIKK